MKSFAVFIVLVAAIAQVHSMEGEKSTEGTNIRQNEQQMRQMGPIPQMNMQMAPKEDLQMRNKAEPSTDMVGSAYGKPAYGGGYGAAYPSVPAPPCPRNYLFSCQPNLTPAPCAQQAASYGSAGAYSQYVPQYALPAPFRY